MRVSLALLFGVGLSSLFLAFSCGGDSPSAADESAAGTGAMSGMGGTGSEVETPACVSDSDCDDGDPCSGDELCEDGVCRGGALIRCDGGEVCNAMSGVCEPSCDADSDGFDSIACGGDDCDDTDSNRYPGNTERCTNPDGTIDEGSVLRDEDCNPRTLGDDKDEDGYFRAECGNADADGEVVFGIDCDDTNDLRRPGNDEICDGIDNDCIGGLDFPGEDDDGDGYADCPSLVNQAFFDCNDADAAVNPGIETDACDGVDVDCDGSPEDADGDGYASVDAVCIGGPLPRLDCNDDAETGGSISPSAIESCNRVDDNCSGAADEGGVCTIATLVAAGTRHTCAATSGGGLRCWGRDASGEVGDGGPSENIIGFPKDVAGFSDKLVTQLVAQGSNTCALTTASELYCWGESSKGPFAAHSGGPRVTPELMTGVEVDVGDKIVAVGLGTDHACAALDSGLIRCWGVSEEGNLGVSSPNTSPNPVTVTGITTATALAIGPSHSCALLADGTVSCWGSDSAGQLGDGPGNAGATQFTPVVVTGLADEVVSLAAGQSHTCAALKSGAVQCWGADNEGQLGNGAGMTADQVSPANVVGLSGSAVTVVAGGQHTCAILASGAMQCWGHGEWGMLGQGQEASSDVPVQVTGLTSGVVAAAAAPLHSCAVLSSGAVLCWGQDAFGQFGVGGGGRIYSVPEYVVGY